MPHPPRDPEVIRDEKIDAAREQLLDAMRVSALQFAVYVPRTLLELELDKIERASKDFADDVQRACEDYQHLRRTIPGTPPDPDKAPPRATTRRRR